MDCHIRKYLAGFEHAVLGYCPSGQANQHVHISRFEPTINPLLYDCVCETCAFSILNFW